MCRATLRGKPRSSNAFESLHAKQLHLEGQVAVRGNDRREAAHAVAVVRRARQLGGLADAHLLHALVPCLDHLADADDKLEGATFVAGAVELAPVRERAWCERGRRTGGGTRQTMRGVDTRVRALPEVRRPGPTRATSVLSIGASRGRKRRARREKATRRSAEYAGVADVSRTGTHPRSAR